MQYLASIKSTMHLREEAYNMILHLLNDILRTDGFICHNTMDCLQTYPQWTVDELSHNG